MGLLKRLVLLPVAPVEGLLWLARTLQEIAEGELDDPAALRARLAAAEEAHRAGEISDAELAAVEDAVLARLVEVKVIEEGAGHG
jgi:hypothetical protein